VGASLLSFLQAFLAKPKGEEKENMLRGQKIHPAPSGNILCCTGNTPATNLPTVTVHPSPNSRFQ